ncbi:unnamed protein product [Prorocentrum cordatum]|uniref:Uncharacterized protein n=1 Tax=Prorocentrum cordatum TaxID=2364126 RepID=A0ABN9V884_9DINO|nr:unnamed protein product [Polarella glacialis]
MICSIADILASVTVALLSIEKAALYTSIHTTSLELGLRQVRETRPTSIQQPTPTPAVDTPPSKTIDGTIPGKTRNIMGPLPYTILKTVIARAASMGEHVRPRVPSFQAIFDHVTSRSKRANEEHKTHTIQAVNYSVNPTLGIHVRHLPVSLRSRDNRDTITMNAYQDPKRLKIPINILPFRHMYSQTFSQSITSQLRALRDLKFPDILLGLNVDLP